MGLKKRCVLKRFVKNQSTKDRFDQQTEIKGADNDKNILVLKEKISYAWIGFERFHFILAEFQP